MLAYLFILHAFECRIQEKHCLEPQVKPNSMAQYKHSTDANQYYSQIHFTMTITGLNISSRLSYSPEIQKMQVIKLDLMSIN